MIEGKRLENSAESSRVAIIGGGPGGLMTAYRLQQFCSQPFQATIFEASPRLGGKILTRQFDSAPVGYEAGAAELYDYSHVGEDPLRELIASLGLTVKPMDGTSVVIDDELLHDAQDVGRVYGPAARRALAEFDARAKGWMSPQEYYDADERMANADIKSTQTFYEELAQVGDPAVERFLRLLVHSDVATEPHRTSAAYGLQNYLMNDSAYLRLYTIDGGIERLPQELASRVEANILLRQPVVCVERVTDAMLRVWSRRDGKLVSEDFDFVVVALPNLLVPAIEWSGRGLAQAMHRHNVHYDYPAHYLRISVLFREPFWKGRLEDSYLMLDAFGGCCLYDESSRNGCETHGVLGWLLAGDGAMRAANHSDDRLIEMMLDSLPSFLREGRELFVEGKVHRWIGSVNGMPGGSPALDMDTRHIPQASLPNLLMVGDYLFDSTLNGVLDSAEFVAETIAQSISQRFAIAAATPTFSAAV